MTSRIFRFLIATVFGCVGPAGTGKTESVKALGNQLGRFVLVFNCDETFDFQVQLLSHVTDGLIGYCIPVCCCCL